MKVRFFGQLQELGELDLEVDTLPEVLSLVKLNCSEAQYATLRNFQHYYILLNSKDLEDVITLRPEVIHTSFQHYDILYIMPQVEGDLPAVIIAGLEAAGVGAAIGATAMTVAAYAISAAIMIGISYGLSALMNSIAPTGVFTGDPAFMQNRLFNGAPLTTEIGGSVPVIVGEPFCTGVLISSGVQSGNF